MTAFTLSTLRAVHVIADGADDRARLLTALRAAPGTIAAAMDYQTFRRRGLGVCDGVDCLALLVEKSDHLDWCCSEVWSEGGDWRPAIFVIANDEFFEEALDRTDHNDTVLLKSAVFALSPEKLSLLLKRHCRSGDIRRATREKLAEMEDQVARYRDLAQVSADRHWYTNEDLTLTQIDSISKQAWLRTDVVVGGTVQEFLTVAGGDPRLADFVEQLESKRSFRNLVFRRALPGERPQSARVSGRPVYDKKGRFQGYRGTVNDVTAEVEQRQSALRAQIRLNEAIETMPAAFMLFDADDRLVLWNTQALDVFRSARAHFTAGASYFQILPPEFSTPNDPGGVRSLQRVPQSRIGRPRDIVNDEGRWLRVIEHQTNEGGIVCVVSDVTELKNREDEAQSARDIAEQANIAKTRFLAAASHDLRQPLHAFGLLLTSLSRRVHDDEAKTLIDRMEKSLESLQGMFNALLDMSRLDAGVMTPEVQEFPIDGILRVLENDLAPLAREKGLEFRCRYSGRYVRSDPMLLERILRNLLSNAIRYTQEGRVFIGARVRDEALRIEVRDSGIGIDAADMQEVFREFHRLGKSVRESRIGLGLGLSIVDRLAQLLGHRLDVQSVVGRGSTFSIEVPLGSMHQQDLGGEGIETISDDALLGLQVAVLDDEPLALEGMVQILSDWGCEIHAAGTVQEFVAGLRSSDNLMGLEPDLLIVDFALGFRETGLVAVEEARKLLGHSIPAVVVTGSTDPDSLAEIRGSGHQLLTKPVTAQQLREMIVRLVAPT